MRASIRGRRGVRRVWDLEHDGCMRKRSRTKTLEGGHRMSIKRIAYGEENRYNSVSRSPGVLDLREQGFNATMILFGTAMREIPTPTF